MSSITTSFADWLGLSALKASLLIALLGLVLWIVRERIPARWRYALWLVVFVRLAIPIAPSSSISVFNLLGRFGGDGPALGVNALPEHTVRSSSVSETVTALPQNVTQTFPTIVVAVVSLWLLVAVILGMRVGISSWRLSRRVSNSTRAGIDPAVRQLLEECKARLHVRTAVELVQSEVVAAPALHGVFRPKLLLPAGLLETFDREEIRFIFLHELAHLRRLDVVASTFVTAIQILYWFHPLVWLAAMRIREERELACDELALHCLQQDERPQYGRTILKLLGTFRTQAPAPALLGILNEKHQMKRRLLMISSFRGPSRATFLYLGLVVAFAAVSLTDASAGEVRRVLSPLGAAEHATLEKLDQTVSFDLKDATLSQVLQAISSATGVAIQQAPEISAHAAQQKRITVNADKVPAHSVLIHALSALELGFDATADGITVNGEKQMKKTIVLDKEDALPGDKKRKVKRFEIRRDELPGEVEIESTGSPEEGERVIELMESEEPLHESVNERVIVRKIHATNEGDSADGVVRRKITMQQKENGVETTGTLLIEVR